MGDEEDGEGPNEAKTSAGNTPQGIELKAVGNRR